MIVNDSYIFLILLSYVIVLSRENEEKK